MINIMKKRMQATAKNKRVGVGEEVNGIAGVLLEKRQQEWRHNREGSSSLGVARQGAETQAQQQRKMGREERQLKILEALEQKKALEEEIQQLLNEDAQDLLANGGMASGELTKGAGARFSGAGDVSASIGFRNSDAREQHVSSTSIIPSSSKRKAEADVGLEKIRNQGGKRITPGPSQTSKIKDAQVLHPRFTPIVFPPRPRYGMVAVPTYSQDLLAFNWAATQGYELPLLLKYRFHQIVEACLGRDESKRGQALSALSSGFDIQIAQLLPTFLSFIAKELMMANAQRDLHKAINLIGMASVIVLNVNLTYGIGEDLGKLLGGIRAIILSPQVWIDPLRTDNWDVRRYAANLLVQVCRKCATSSAEVLQYEIGMFDSYLTMKEASLPAIYGAIAVLAVLGADTVTRLILPKIRDLGVRLESVMLNAHSPHVDKVAGMNIMELLVAAVCPVLKLSMPPPARLKKFTDQFGYFGERLQRGVIGLRMRDTRHKGGLSSGATTPQSTEGAGTDDEGRGVNEDMGEGAYDEREAGVSATGSPI